MKTIIVSVAILYVERKVLLCQRSYSSRYPLKWEFPGGKKESDETAYETMCRECKEELGITVSRATLLHENVSTYDDGGSFTVSFFLVTSFEGEIIGKVFNDFKWVDPNDLLQFDLLSGNIDFCRVLPEMLTEFELSRQK